MLQKDPPPGIAAFLEQDDMSLWRAEIIGPEPFENAVFTVRVQIPPRYPFEPPLCQFVGKMIPYHPNIDSSGRICLDTLKIQPFGSWSPAVSLPSLLLSLRSLLADPNPDDGLVAEISSQYKTNPDEWKAEAKRRTKVINTEMINVSHKRLTEQESVSSDHENNNHNFKRRKLSPEVGL